MKFNVNRLKKLVKRTKFRVSKHSPEILLVTGSIGVVASFVAGCIETVKAQDVIKDTNEKIDAVKVAETRLKDGEELHTEDGEEYTEKNVKMDKVIIYKDTAVSLAKVYYPSVLLLTASMGCIFKSHGIMKKRNAALAAAYAGVSQLFKEYRSRVVSELGEEADKKFRHGISTITVTNDDGKGNVTTEEVSVLDPSNHSPYAKFFDEASPYWEKDSEYNLMFLTAQQNYANDKLRANGMLFLNEVYDALGLPRTKAGQVVGWVYDDENPIGDNYVDFGIYNLDNEKARDFVNGYERSIILDFNVDGNVWDLMK